MTAKYTIVLIRHGESEYNKENRFCGWYDADLSGTGLEEAKNAGKVRKNTPMAGMIMLMYRLGICQIPFHQLLEYFHLYISSFDANQMTFKFLMGINRAVCWEN